MFEVEAASLLIPRIPFLGWVRKNCAIIDRIEGVLLNGGVISNGSMIFFVNLQQKKLFCEYKGGACFVVTALKVQQTRILLLVLAFRKFSEILSKLLYSFKFLTFWGLLLFLKY